MGVTPAEPLGDTAAELALEFDEVGAVSLAACVAEAQLLRTALSTNELFWFEFLLGGLCGDAIFHSAEVCHLALVARIVGEFVKGPRLQVIVVVVVRVLEARVLVDAFVFGAFNALFVHLLFH